MLICKFIDEIHVLDRRAGECSVPEPYVVNLLIVEDDLQVCCLCDVGTDIVDWLVEPC
jgi:hypothetical protein